MNKPLPFQVRQVPAARGRALTAEQVAEEIFSGTVTARWVLRYFKPGRDRIGWRTVVWWEVEVLRWRDTHQLGGAHED
jgi:hypothetical protein